MKSVQEVTENLRGMSWDDFNLQEDLFIDKNRLDEEAEKHPMLLAKWSNVLAQAQKERDAAQQKFKVTEADLTSRGFAGESPKKTGDGVKSWVRSHDEYKLAYSEFNKAEANVAFLWGAKQSIEAKRNMIELTAKLYLAGYYSTVELPAKLQDEADSCTQRNIRAGLEKTIKKRIKRKSIKR